MSVQQKIFWHRNGVCSGGHKCVCSSPPKERLPIPTGGSDVCTYVQQTADLNIHTTLFSFRSNQQQWHYSLDFLDGFDAEVADVAAVEVLAVPVEAALEGVAETLRADFRLPACCVRAPRNITEGRRKKKYNSN